MFLSLRSVQTADTIFALANASWSCHSTRFHLQGTRLRTGGSDPSLGTPFTIAQPSVLPTYKGRPRQIHSTMRFAQFSYRQPSFNIAPLFNVDKFSVTEDLASLARTRISDTRFEVPTATVLKSRFLGCDAASLDQW